MTWRFNQRPSEAEGIKPDSVDEETVESIASPIDPVAQLQADLNAAKAEIAEWQDRFLRKAAEFENFGRQPNRQSFPAGRPRRASLAGPGPRRPISESDC